MHEPGLSVVIPARDDAAHLPATVRSVVDQDLDVAFDVTIAVGPSADGTREVADALAAEASLDADGPPVRVVDNPAGSTPAALNAAIAASSGPVIVRVDAHSEVPPGYLRIALATLTETGAVNVGGIQDALGETPFQRAVAAAMTSRFGVGGGAVHLGGSEGPVDTVYLGAFRRDALDAVGGYDESLIRNQDYELNWRLRDAGGTVWFDPDLRVVYRPRSTLSGLAGQYLGYGRWKREVLRRHPRSIRPRQLAAPLLVAGLAGSVGLGLVGRRGAALAVPAAYLAGVVVAAVSTALGVDHEGRGSADRPGTAVRLVAIYPTMHLSWGVGFLLGPS
ncbi:MAG: glycosyltransferase family 2 protein [Acidimicrobiales bacterium]